MKNKAIEQGAFFWALQGLCALHRKPFSPELAQQQIARPYTVDALLRGVSAYGFDAKLKKLKAGKLCKESFPLVAWLAPRRLEPAAEVVAQSDAALSVEPEHSDILEDSAAVGLVLQVDANHVLIVEPEDAAPRTITHAEFNERYLGHVASIAPKSDPAADPDSEAEARRRRKFGFHWFVPELLKHKKLWQEILLASLVIQLIALATPLFTQTIIDKVVVHRTQSTLVVIAIGMAIFMAFSAGLSWLRQYLVSRRRCPGLFRVRTRL